MNMLNLRRSLATGAVAVLTAWPAAVCAQVDGATAATAQAATKTAPKAVQNYRVAACDWMMLKRQKIGEFQLAHDIGADGIEMDMGPLGQRVLFDNKLREPHFQQLFRHKADSLGVQVPSVAMSGFFAQSLLKRVNYMALLDDCLKTMDVMGARVAFLPLGGSGNEWQKPGSEARREMVSRLHEMGQRAAAQGKVIAVRTQLDARANLILLKEISSPGIKIYYNLQDAVDRGLDPSKELKRLGARNIAQIHASLTDSVTLDCDPRIDLRRVKKTLDRMHWTGWLVVERSRNARDVKNVRKNYGTNVAYLKEIFQK